MAENDIWNPFNPHNPLCPRKPPVMPPERMSYLRNRKQYTALPLEMVRDFMDIEVFAFASRLYKTITSSAPNDYTFHRVHTVEIEEPTRTSSVIWNETLYGQEASNNSFIHDIQDCVGNVQVMGVLGANQYTFFQWIFPEKKIVDVKKFNSSTISQKEEEDDYDLVCHNEYHAFFHVKRIQMLQDLILEYMKDKNSQIEKLISDKWSYIFENILKIKDFIYVEGLTKNVKDHILNNRTLNMKDEEQKNASLIISSVNMNITRRIDGGLLNIRNFIDYYVTHLCMNACAKEPPVFAVLGIEQYFFLTKLFSNDLLHERIVFVDILQFIPEELDFTCEDEDLYCEYHARRIRLIQENLKSKCIISSTVSQNDDCVWWKRIINKIVE